MIIQCILLFILIIFINTLIMKSSNSIKWFPLLLLGFFVYMIVAGNYDNADVLAYKTTYNNANSYISYSTWSQWGYNFIIFVCKSFGLSFQQYRMVTYAIGYIALFFAIKKMTVNEFSPIILYMIYPMIIDSTQMKNFVSMAFLILAISFIMEPSKKGKLFFVVFIFISASFHVVAYIYLPLAILISNADKKIKYTSVGFIVLISIVFSNRKYSNVLVNLLLSNMNETLFNKSSAYLISRTNLGFLIYAVANIFLIVLIMYMKKTIEGEFIQDIRLKRISNIAIYCSVYSLLFIPFYFFRLEFVRLFRNTFMIYHIMFISFLNRKKNTNINNNRMGVLILDKNNLIVSLLYIGLLIYMFYWDISGHYDIVIKPFFESNIFFK